MVEIEIDFYLGITMPSAKHLRRLAEYVDVERLRTIDDADLIASMFTEVKKTLLSIADSVEKIHTHKKAGNGDK